SVVFDNVACFWISGLNYAVLAVSRFIPARALDSLMPIPVRLRRGTRKLRMKKEANKAELMAKTQKIQMKGMPKGAGPRGPKL
ncbi:hypothetical protein RJ641_001204, partial [Dillenia turbinata]